MNDQVITLTDAAIDHIKNMAKKVDNAKGFRLSLKKTGCSGMAYVPDIISKVNDNDFHFVQQDLHIYVDREHENFLRDTVIDYVADNVGLKQKRLVFINPHEKNRCGCGESFTTE
jgi:iron-sulfur cluster assembly accessory protein